MTSSEWLSGSTKPVEVIDMKPAEMISCKYIFYMVAR